MKKPPKNPVREDRIENEAIPDAHGPEEQATSWHYYLEDRLAFPFQAKCIAAVLVSPLKKGEAVGVLAMAPPEYCAHDMLVLTRWQDRKLAVPLSQLLPVGTVGNTIEATADWHYWVARGYLL